MIDVEKFVGVMRSAGVDFFTGVPDSLLKGFCAYVADKSEKIGECIMVSISIVSLI